MNVVLEELRVAREGAYQSRTWCTIMTEGQLKTCDFEFVERSVTVAERQ